jgi:hypothetical protein
MTFEIMQWKTEEGFHIEAFPGGFRIWMSTGVLSVNQNSLFFVSKDMANMLNTNTFQIMNGGNHDTLMRRCPLCGAEVAIIFYEDEVLDCHAEREIEPTWPLICDECKEGLDNDFIAWNPDQSIRDQIREESIHRQERFFSHEYWLDFAYSHLQTCRSCGKGLICGIDYLAVGLCRQCREPAKAQRKRKRRHGL